MRGRRVFLLFKPIILCLSRLLRLLPVSMRYGIFALFRSTPGLPGLGIRYIVVKSIAKNCGDNVYVGPYVFLTYLENCSIGKNVSIREFCNIGGLGGLTIGDDVSIASNSVILTTEHDYTGMLQMRSGDTVRKPVIIEDGVWIGAGVSVTAGVTIGRGSVIGTGAVVTKTIPPDSIAVGVPAEVIKERTKREKC